MMRGEGIFASAAEEGDASDIAQMTVASIGMTERFRSIRLRAAGSAQHFGERLCSRWRHSRTTSPSPLDLDLCRRRARSRTPDRGRPGGEASRDV